MVAVLPQELVRVPRLDEEGQGNLHPHQHVHGAYLYYIERVSVTSSISRDSITRLRCETLVLVG